MNMFSLRTIIDDILLIVRNNNISESEDLSRAQIASWVLQYKAALIKARKDKEDQADNEGSDDNSLTEMLKEIGPLSVDWETDADGNPTYRKKTVEPIPSILDKDRRYLFCVHDIYHMPIQYMSEERKYFHRFRKYTFGEITYEYEIDKDGKEWLIFHGIDLNYLNKVWIEGLFSDTDENGEADEDNVTIPGWMIPDIKANIMKNELSFMLQRISDDDNNSTLDGIKPQTSSQIGAQK